MLQKISDFIKSKLQSILKNRRCPWTPNKIKMAYWVLSVFSTRSESVMLTLFRSLVRSRLEYSCPVWNPSLLGDIKKLESTQRVFTRYINGCQDLCYWDRLKTLGLMSLQRRRERYIIIHVWKTLHELAPNDIGIIFYVHIRLGTHCRIPPLKRTPSTINPLRSWDLNSGTSSPRVSNQLRVLHSPP